MLEDFFENSQKSFLLANMDTDKSLKAEREDLSLYTFPVTSHIICLVKSDIGIHVK